MTTVSSELMVNPNAKILQFLDEIREIVDRRLDQFVPACETEPVRIHQAIRWSLFAGGKRLRPALVFAVGRAFESDDVKLVDIACAFELIHTYSLIHDDLPAMDDDDLRRGRPSCHIRFGEAAAILAGDALQALAFQIVAESERLMPETRIRVLREISVAAGTPEGMVAGQQFDLEAESRQVDRKQLEEIHTRKTGALFTAAARCGALIAGASEVELNRVTGFAAKLGLLFQITDDLLDVTASSEELGKTAGKDERAFKATYPSVCGLQFARELAIETHKNAIEELEQLGRRPIGILRALADFTLSRRA